MKIHFLLLAGAVVLPHASLRAQDAPEAPRPIQVGFALNLGAPMGNLKSDLGNQVTITGSFILPIQMGQGWVIRPRVDLGGWEGENRLHQGGAYRENVRTSMTGVGADALFFPGGNSARGLFLSGGVSAQRWEVTYKAAGKPAGLPTYATEQHVRKTSPAFALGAGYQFNRTIGLEFRAMTSEYPVLNRTVSAGSLTGGTQGTRRGTSCQLATTFTW